MAAATATALVSEPPRPSVVMLPSASMPWKPATTAISPRSSVSKIFDAVDGLDAGLGERVVREDAHLVAEERARLAALGVDGHRREGRADLLAGRGDGVHLARVGDLGHLVREREQAIGLAAHRAHDERRRGCPRAGRRERRRATLRIRSIEPTEVPPNFWTTSATGMRRV